MKVVSVNLECDRKSPNCRITDHESFISVVLLSNGGPHISIWVDDLRTLINFKNNLLSAFDKAIREAKSV